jgi:hypothetical protein
MLAETPPRLIGISLAKTWFNSIREMQGAAFMNTLYENPLQLAMQTGEAESGEAFEFGEAEAEAETQEHAAPFPEAQEMGLASEALEVSSEEELEQFLGDAISTAAKGIGGFLRSGTGQSLVSMLKPIATQALPSIGSAIGGMLGGSAGAQIGSQLAPDVGHMFGLELEGLSNEDREFEVARNLTRLAGAAAQHAATCGGAGDDRSIARAALMHAARRHAPGILGNVEAPLCPHCGSAMRPHRHHQHRWVRQGTSIIVFNA